jgi:hypothetical protein
MKKMNVKVWISNKCLIEHVDQFFSIFVQKSLCGSMVKVWHFLDEVVGLNLAKCVHVYMYA